MDYNYIDLTYRIRDQILWMLQYPDLMRLPLTMVLNKPYWRKITLEGGSHGREKLTEERCLFIARYADFDPKSRSSGTVAITISLNNSDHKLARKPNLTQGTAELSGAIPNELARIMNELLEHDYRIVKSRGQLGGTDKKPTLGGGHVALVLGNPDECNPEDSRGVIVTITWGNDQGCVTPWMKEEKDQYEKLRYEQACTEFEVARRSKQV